MTTRDLLFASALTLACAASVVGSSAARAQDRRPYDTVSDSHVWTGLSMTADLGFHSGIKPGNGAMSANGLPYSTIDDSSFNFRMGLVAWPTVSPFTEGATVFGQSVGFSLELWGGVYTLFGGGGSEDYGVRGGLVIDLLYPVIQAKGFALAATFQGGLVGDSNYGGAQFGPGGQILFQTGIFRVLGEYRFIPFWIGDNVVQHDMRVRLHLQPGDGFYFGLFGNVSFTEVRRQEGGYTMDTVGTGLEIGF